MVYECTYLSVCLSVCLPVQFSPTSGFTVCLSACLPVCLPVCLSVCLSVPVTVSSTCPEFLVCPVLSNERLHCADLGSETAVDVGARGADHYSEVDGSKRWRYNKGHTQAYYRVCLFFFYDPVETRAPLTLSLTESLQWTPWNAADRNHLHRSVQ